MGIVGTVITGTSTTKRVVNGSDTAPINTMMPRKKRKAGEVSSGGTESVGDEKLEESKINLLGAGMIRKKPKVAKY